MAKKTSVKSKHGGAKVWLPPPVSYLTALVLGGILHWALPLPMGVEAFPGVVVGVLFAAAGVYLIAHAFLWHRHTGQDPKPWKPSPKLILSGPYRFTRNPMYLGMTLIVMGVGLGMTDGWFVIGALCAALVVHFSAILPEEAYLARKFGAKYLRFKAQTRRWV